MVKNISISKRDFSYCLLNEIYDIQNLVSKNILESYMNSNTHILYTATYDNKILGFLIASNLIDVIDIEYLFVCENHRRKNIAFNMINSLCIYAKKHHIPSIMLEVRQSNKGAINLYTKAGFETINIRKNYYKENGENAIIMKKSIL